MGHLAESRIVWCVGLLLALVALRFISRRFAPQPLEVVSVRIDTAERDMPSDDDLKLRKSVRAAVASLGLGETVSLQDAKTGRQFMSVWLHVPDAERVVRDVERALGKYPVRVRALGPPVDMSSTAMLRLVPAVWRGLVASWHETKR